MRRPRVDLSNYAGLTEAIAKFLGRTDLTDDIPAFIQLAEAQIRRRLRRKTVRTTITIAQETTTLPTDCAELRTIHLVTSSRGQDGPITVGTYDMLAETRARYQTAGRPIRAAMVDRKLVVAPEPDQPYTADITYFQQLTSLSGAVTVNDTLSESPDLYLFGALKEAEPFLEHDERVPLWQSKFESALAELDLVREREETNASIKEVRLPRRFG